MPSLSKAKEIINFIESLGYIPVQIGLPDQPQLCKNRFIVTFFETIKFVLSIIKYTDNMIIIKIIIKNIMPKKL